MAQYKQLTLEEAEEKMKNRKKTADGYERWMMKAANNGAAAFGEVEKFDDKEGARGGGRGRRKATGDENEGNASDRGEEDEEEEATRKNRLGLNKKGGGDDDDDEGPRGGDHDMDDDDIEKGKSFPFIEKQSNSSCTMSLSSLKNVTCHLLDCLLDRSSPSYGNKMHQMSGLKFWMELC